MPRSSVSSGRIWSLVTSEGTGSGRAECSRGFSWSALGAVIPAQQKTRYFLFLWACPDGSDPVETNGRAAVFAVKVVVPQLGAAAAGGEE